MKHWLFLLALLLTATVAFAQSPTPLVTADAGMPHGLAPMPGDAAVPRSLLPPGAEDPDTGPSKAIFPPQQITLRFNHKLHLTKEGATCKTCHARALVSNSATDTLIPPGVVCDACHLTDHANLDKVVAGDGPEGKCGFCHVGYHDGDGNAVARLVVPRPNMAFSHQKHLTRNIACQQCHGAVEELELATRDQMPRMRGCFKCHQMDDAAGGKAAQGEARSDCTTCHLRALGSPVSADKPAATGAEVPAAMPAWSQGSLGNRIRTVFPSGVLTPPRWLHNAGHGPDFVRRHKWAAADDSSFCANCHKEDFCVGCHDGRVRPKNIHPSDYLSMHPVEARLATQKCTSCHREQSFCLGCHQRVGVSMTGPPAAKDSGRFHPDKKIWSELPRTTGHHSFEAERNLNACVSCHTERDCVVCHGGTGIGGGFDPHKNGFAGGCATQMRRNPRPCYVCHLPGDSDLSTCR